MEMTKKYGEILALNLTNIGVKSSYQDGNVYLLLNEGEQVNKAWLYTLLQGLPEIDAPLERLQLIVYVGQSIQFVTVINPSEFDVTAMDSAINNGLNFSKPPFKLEPLPLNHPWYSDKDYFKKQPKKKKGPITFDDIKDLPSVKPIIDDIRKAGFDV